MIIQFNYKKNYKYIFISLHIFLNLYNNYINMSRILNNSKNIYQTNKSYNLLTPRIDKINKSLNEFYINDKSSIEGNESSILNLNLDKKKSPKDILSTLLKNILDKPLIKLETKTKENMNILKLIGKNFLDFNKNIKSLITGVEKKKKEEEEKKLNYSKRLKISKTPFRSKTTYNIRTPKRDKRTISPGQSRNNKYLERKTKSKIGNRNLSRKSEKANLEVTSKNYPKTPHALKNINNYGIKTKDLKDNYNFYKKIDNNPKRGRGNLYNRIQNKMSSINLKNSIKEEDNQSILKNKYHTINNNANSRTKKRKKSIKNYERGAEKRKSIKNTEKLLEKKKSIRNLEKRKSLKNTERGQERRKSIKSSRNEERNNKRKGSIKKKIKIDGNFKIKNSININDNNLTEDDKAELERKISNFNFKDINIINNNINILNNNSFNNNILKFEDTDDIDLKSSDNIKISEIINSNIKSQIINESKKGEGSYIKNELKTEDKEEPPRIEGDLKSEDKKEPLQVKNAQKKEEETPHAKSDLKTEEEPPHIKKVIKELEEHNEKKLTLKEKEKEKDIIKPKERMKSCNKNRDRKNFDSISLDDDIAGSLNDVKLMIEGVSGVLNKINDPKFKIEKRRPKANSVYEDLNNEEKNKRNENTEKDKKENNKLLSEIDKEIMELIENEEKRQKKKNDKEKDKQNNEEQMININNKERRSEINDKRNKNRINSKLESEDNKLKDVNKNRYNSPLSRKIKLEKEKQIMNEDIINKIKTEDNILTSDLNDININLDKQIKENNNNENEDNVESIISKVNNIIQEIECKNNNYKTNKTSDNEKNINKAFKRRKSNYLNNLEKQLIEKNKLNNELCDVIQSESLIMHEEQLIDFINNSLSQSSLVNQSSLINQSQNLGEQYIYISREKNYSFSIENVLKYEKKIFLGILDYLNFQEKMEFTGINRWFIFERISALNIKREELIRSLELEGKDTIEDVIMRTRLKYSKEQLSKKFNEFQIATGASKAVLLLDNEVYSKLFEKPYIEKNEDEICNVYRILMVLINEYDIANIINNKLFWKKCTEYLNRNSKGKIGSFIFSKFKNIRFEHKKYILLNKLLIGMKQKFNASYFSKICGTTGLLIFIIKDALEYCSILSNEKKTQPSRMLDTLLCFKKTIDKLAIFMEYLSGVKTYKIRDKKSIK